MAVDPEVSRALVRQELEQARALAETYAWAIAVDGSGVVVTANLRAYTGELFVVELECTNYREQPPLVEFLEPDTGARGTRRAYPRSTDSLFHESGPCVCAPFNRKAYKTLYPTGPHGDWPLGDWAACRANNYDWARVATLGGILGVLQARLDRPDTFRGRMG